MISLPSIALASVLAVGTPQHATAPCGESIHRTRVFGPDFDWERAGNPGAQRGIGFLQTVRGSGGAERTAGLDCAFREAVDPRRRAVVPSLAVSQWVLPESATPLNPKGPSWLRPFSFFVSTTGVYDSNINHDEEPVRDSGAVFGVGTRFETSSVEVEYEVASHNYQNTDRWDRISHSLTSSYEQKITRKLSMEAVGEMALKGSSEDRELGDQYIFEPRIHYRISRSTRLRLYGAHRLRRYDENSERDATNQYVGLELRRRLGRGTFDLGYRLETNRADGPRYSYDRQTYSAQFSTPLTGGLHRVGIELRYRPQQYSNRFVDDEEDEDLRRDERWVFSVGGSFALGRHLELLPGYKFETRSSNDPEKKFDAHAAYVGLRYWFGTSGNPGIASRSPVEAPAESARKEGPAKRKEPAKTDTASLPTSRSKTALQRPAATSSELPAPPPGGANASIDKWARRAEEDRRRLVSGDAGSYAIELDLVCGGARFLEEAWRHDSRAGSMWLIRSEPPCYRVFWGHFSSEYDARHALRSIPPNFRNGLRRPLVVMLAAGSAVAQGNRPSRGGRAVNRSATAQ